MNYELALKLKEAGFPQNYRNTELWCDFAYEIGDDELHHLHYDNDTDWWIGNDYNHSDLKIEKVQKDWIKVPSLEELLEQMPMRKKYLGTVNDAHFVLRKVVTVGGEEYFAAYEDEDTGVPVPKYEFYGSAREAVANLWLALNSKQPPQ